MHTGKSQSIVVITIGQHDAAYVAQTKVKLGFVGDVLHVFANIPQAFVIGQYDACNLCPILSSCMTFPDMDICMTFPDLEI